MRSSRVSSLPVRAVTLGIILAFLILAAGCTQPGIPSPFPATPSPTPSNGVTATRPDTSHIVVAYNGGPNMETLFELDATVTDSQGKSSTQHIGSKTATSPIRIGGTIKFEGAYSGNNHVLVTGFFNDGSQRIMLDTTV